MSAQAAPNLDRPADPIARGRGAMGRGDFAAAAADFLAQSTAAPSDPEPRYWLASALAAAGDAQGADQAMHGARNLHSLAILRSAGADMARFQTDADYCMDIGQRLYANHLMGAASLVFAKSLALGRSDATLLLSYGVSLQHQGRNAEAIEAFTTAAQMFPHPGVHQFLIYALFRAPDRLQRVSEEARRWGELYASPDAAASVRFGNQRSTSRRLRIGYFAPSLTRSQVSTSTLAVFEAHDPAAVKVFLYSGDPAAEAAVPETCTLRGLGGLSDEDAAALIRRDRIDILVDVWGHTAGSRLRMFSLRPAPVQVGWINFMQTTGLACMDYILHADSMEAPGTEAYFTEEIWRTGAVMAPYRPTTEAAAPTPTPALKNGFVTFGSFNNPAKLSDETVAAWGAILRARPNDRLLLKYSYFADPVLQRATQARLAAHGANLDQVVFRGHSTGADYAREFADVDLALDPSPCPGGTTTLDAICNGVPVLAMKGDDFYARTCLPLLLPCGLGELVTGSWGEYVDRALAVTADIRALDRMRARIRPGFDASPYRDEVGFTRRLEGMYREMFGRWVEKTQAAKRGNAA